MDNSYMTREIAHGIYLYACVQNLPEDTSKDDGVARAMRLTWAAWTKKYPIFVDAVKKEQFNLFDRCLNGSLGR
jgi:hypothetical protein